jgi:hypothetical protein
MAVWATSTLGSQLPLQTARAGDASTSATPAIAAARKTIRVNSINVTDLAFPTGTAVT